MLVIANIGSNLGDRRLNLSRAMRAINKEFGDFELSNVVETEPWGYDSDNKFLNIGIMFHSELQPQQVLEKLKEIETAISAMPHRDASGGYADRLIDIDIVAIDDIVVDTPELKVPHPHLAQRKFFLVPLEEQAPGWRHPLTHKTATEMLNELDTTTVGHD